MTNNILSFGISFAPTDTFAQAFRQTARMRRLLGIYGGNLSPADLADTYAVLDSLEEELREHYANAP